MKFLKTFCFILALVLTSQLFGQRISFIDKDKSNELLFNENDPVSLVSIAKKFVGSNVANYDYTHDAKVEYTSPELVKFLSLKGLLTKIDSVIGLKYFVAVPSRINGQDSLQYNPDTGTEETVVQERTQIDYFDLKDISRIVVFEKSVSKTQSGESNYEIDKIGFAKKYKETGERYFITFAVDFKDLMVANGVTLRVTVPNATTKLLVDTGDKKSLISQLKQLQFNRFFQDSLNNKPKGSHAYEISSIDFPSPENIINYFDGQYDIEFYYYENQARKDWAVELPLALNKKNIRYLKGNYRYQPVPSQLTGLDSVVIDPPTGVETTITELVFDSVTYWIDLDISSLLLSYSIGFRDSMGYGNGVISPTPGRIKFYSELAPGLRYYFSAFNLGEDFMVNSNLNLLNAVFPYQNSSEFPSVKFFDEYQRNKHTYFVANKKGRRYIKKNFYVNEYFKGNDPFFGQFFK